MRGFHNQFLRVNLSEHTLASEELSDEVLKCYLDGKGLGAHRLVENAPRGVDPLAPESPVVVATGPSRGSLPAIRSSLAAAELRLADRPALPRVSRRASAPSARHHLSSGSAG